VGRRLNIVPGAKQISALGFEPELLFDLIRPPFRRFEFSTLMSREHVVKALQHVVEPTRFEWWPSKRRGYFEGYVNIERFKFSRIIRYRNSFLPIVDGTLRGEAPETTVTLRMRMAWPVIVLWLGMLGTQVSSLATGFPQITGWVGTTSGLIEGMAFLYLMASIGFGVEARIAMKRLSELLRPACPEFPV
jgi:hypothetical protein